MFPAMNQQNPAHTLPLMLSLMNCVASSVASHWLRQNSARFDPQEQQALNALPQALLDLGKKQLDQLHASVKKLESATRPRDLSGAVIWQKGNARLLDLGGDVSKPPLILIPSLINRAYILDLDEDRSVARYLSRVACPLLLDWGVPGDLERKMDAAAYTESMLVPMLEYVTGVTKQRAHLLGYCMGGVLSLGLATLTPEKIASLGLFATPWDFNAPDANAPKLDEETIAGLEKLIHSMPEFPAQWIQTLFYMQHLELMQAKYMKIAEMSESSLREFLALEQWVNDAVPLAKGVAIDCLIDWVQRNTLKKGEWNVDGKAVNPKKLDHPTFIAAPQHDQIVPNGVSKALHSVMPHAMLVEPDAGHVGMMVGTRSRKQCLEPYARFLALHHA